MRSCVGEGARVGPEKDFDYIIFMVLCEVYVYGFICLCVWICMNH